MKEHELKIWPEFFDDVAAGRKRFEIRKDDRMGFAVGDHLILKEWKPMILDGVRQRELGTFTGRKTVVLVTYVLADSPLLKPKYVALGVEPVKGREL